MVRQVGLEKALLIYMNPEVSMYPNGVMKNVERTSVAKESWH